MENINNASNQDINYWAMNMWNVKNYNIIIIIINKKPIEFKQIIFVQLFNGYNNKQELEIKQSILWSIIL